jgi:hypothetical protein
MNKRRRAYAGHVIFSLINGVTLSLDLFVYKLHVHSHGVCRGGHCSSSWPFFGLGDEKGPGGLGAFLIMAVFGLIISSVLNLIPPKEALIYVNSFAACSFSVLTAYDTVPDKPLLKRGSRRPEQLKRLPSSGSELYLDLSTCFEPPENIRTQKIGFAVRIKRRERAPGGTPVFFAAGFMALWTRPRTRFCTIRMEVLSYSVHGIVIKFAVMD